MRWAPSASTSWWAICPVTTAWPARRQSACRLGHLGRKINGVSKTLRYNITNCALYLAVVFPECCVQNCEPEGAIGWTGRSYFSIWTLVLSSFCLRKVPEPRKATNKLAVGAKDTRSGIFVEMMAYRLSFPVTREGLSGWAYGNCDTTMQPA